MGNLKALQLDKVITKPYLKNQVKTKILTKKPYLINDITDKVLVKCLIYISGYIKCFNYHGIQPINEREVLELLTQECIDWIVEYVEGGGK